MHWLLNTPLAKAGGFPLATKGAFPLKPGLSTKKQIEVIQPKSGRCNPHLAVAQCIA